MVPREVLDDARESTISQERIQEGALSAGVPGTTMYVISEGDTLRAFTVATPEQGMFEWLIDLELRVRALEAGNKQERKAWDTSIDRWKRAAVNDRRRVDTTAQNGRTMGNSGRVKPFPSPDQSSPAQLPGVLPNTAVIVGGLLQASGEWIQAGLARKKGVS